MPSTRRELFNRPTFRPRDGYGLFGGVGFSSGLGQRARPLERVIVVVGSPGVYRECLVNSLAASRPDWIVIPVSNIVEWRKAAPDQGVPAAILFSVSRSRPIDVPEQLRFLCYSRDWIRPGGNFVTPGM